MTRDPRPACLVTGAVTPYRAEPFRLLAQKEGLDVIAFRDPGAPVPGLTVHAVSELGAARLVASGAYRAVICGLGGRLALPGAYAGARKAGIPFVLWASLWAHPRSLAHALSLLPTRLLYRRADAVVTYGRHVSAYVAARRGSSDGIFEAPQAVDGRHFGSAVSDQARSLARQRLGAPGDAFAALFVGRLEREKGVQVLLDGWRRSGLGRLGTLSIAGAGSLAPLAQRPSGVRSLGPVDSDELPALYAAADVLVLPSIQTATFREPWGLVVNESMHQGTPVIATDAVGAVAGGLLRHERNGLVAPHGDPQALAVLLRRVAADRGLRERLGTAAREDVAAFSFEAWVAGMRGALAAVGASRGGQP